APTKAGTGAAKGSVGMGGAPAAPASASTPTRAEAVRGMQDIVQASAPFLQSLGNVRSCEGIEEARGPCYSARRVPSDPAVGRGAAGLARPARLAAAARRPARGRRGGRPPPSRAPPRGGGVPARARGPPP